MAKYAIGIDYGTLSARAVLVDVHSGEIAADASFSYPHAVMDTKLPCGTSLKPGWALEHPDDYELALERTIRRVMEKSGVDSRDVVGIGVDATACTILPLDKQGQPLCRRPEYASEPNAYIKIWKHHGANERAQRMTASARELKLPWLDSFGGHISGESMFPRLWELMEEAPALYADMYEYAEAADWLVFLLTGERMRNSCAAGYKAYYRKSIGYPGEELFRTVAKGLDQAVREKLPSPVKPAGSYAGGLLPEMAAKLSLRPGTPVAVGHVDAHVSAAAAGVTDKGEMLMIIGTSACDMLLSDRSVPVPGICGIVEDGILPGFYGYEAGQSSVGDLYQHFIENAVPASYADEAAARGMNLHQYLTMLAEKLRPGESGILALDWLSGNRSVLADFDLSAMVLGISMLTRPEHIYRALIEATAFGTKVIIENYRKNGVPVEHFTATGGVSLKNPFAMQLYADILEMPVHVVNTPVGPALGSAVFGALAAGGSGGGYDDVTGAIRAMSGRIGAVYQPREENFAVYRSLYSEYCRLYDTFGRGLNPVMKNLRALSQAAKR